MNLKTDKSTTDNSAVAWFSGSASAYHYLKTGTESLIISTPNNINAMEIAGTATGLANEGKISFYKDVNINASLICTGYIDAPILTSETKAKDTGGITIKRSDGNNNIRIYDSGSIITYGDLDIIGGLTVYVSRPNVAQAIKIIN